jgi:prepilin-type N-terminal cleavage/methylation domain-containing protein
MRFSASHQARRRGVTLTELLAVICIITILASLTFIGISTGMRFADRMQQEAQAAVAKVHFNADKVTRATLPPIMVGPVWPTGPRPARYPGHYYVGLSSSVTDPKGEAQRLASLVGGSVVGVYTHGVYGCGLACDDSKSSLLSADPAVTGVSQATAIYLCQAPKNIQRVFSNGISGREATTPVNKMFGAPPSIYRMYRNTNIQGIVTARTYLPASASPSIAVAIMDTGVDWTHPDLNVTFAADFTSFNDPMDRGGHGTHVAGVVGAVDKLSSGGVVGVYPGAPLVSLKVLATTPPSAKSSWSEAVGGSSLHVYSALDFLIAHASGIPVCLMPFHTVVADPIMDAMVNNAASLGVIMVAAAGQNGAGANFNLDKNPVSPASAAGSITVGGMVDTDGLPGGFGGAGDDIYSNGGGSLSNYGSVVAFAAPSGNTTGGGSYAIKSTIPIAGQLANGLANPYSDFLFGVPINPQAQGQSFACAHVAGMMALLKDPQTNLGFVLGAGRGVTSYRPQMNSRDSAVQALFNATHQTGSFQMINPLTGSVWQVSGFPHRVTPYMKSLYGDYVTDPNGRAVPVANFYVNPSLPPSFLSPFPG